MLKYLIRKIYYGILVMLGVVVIVFWLFQGFGDPARLVMGQRADQATQENIRKELMLDQPKWKQFLHYLNDISPLSIHSAGYIEEKNLKGIFIPAGGDNRLAIKLPYLRRSYQTEREVGEMLVEALGGTIVLAVSAMLLATVMGIFLGVIAALNKGTWLDSGSVFASIIGISAPSFFIGIIIAYVFGFLLSHITGLQMTGSLYEIDPFFGPQLQLKNLILPAITLGIRPLAIITQLTRSSMLDVLEQDFIRTAYAKGLPTRRIVFVHALRNALNPVITAITGWFAELLAGAFFVEYIFGWKGIGKLTVDALEKLDFPVVMGAVLISSAFFILINILADWLYGVIDPRVNPDRKST
ncbi:MAG TPA: ABC transporter permease [Parasegetibacter sp.]